jgi:hypothetical protein
MKDPARAYANIVANAENNSILLLMEKMGISKEEVLEVCASYGVSAEQMVKRMQSHKYRFIFSEKKDYCIPQRIKIVTMFEGKAS